MSKAFGGFIVSYLRFDGAMPPDDLTRRRKNFHRQLEWWIGTKIPIHAILSGWTNLAVESDPMLALLIAAGGTYSRVPARALILNRIEQLNALYASDFDWGIIMDDDAVLYDEAHHGRGPRLFTEMATNGIAAYAGVDVFFPINPQKIGFNPIWAKNPPLYAASHVFERSIDLKGSMSIVRNFRKEGKAEVLPDATFTLHGEDRQFALEAVAMGYSVMRCDSIVLREYGGPSHYAAGRLAAMKTGYAALAAKYAAFGLAMKPESHRHYLKAFWAACWGDKPKTVIV